MGKRGDKWEEFWFFWRPFLLGGMALLILAVVTMAMLSHHRESQRAYVEELKSQPINHGPQNDHDPDMVIATAKASALATVDVKSEQ